MSNFWCGFVIATWVVVGWAIWLFFCWYEGSSEPKGDGTLTPAGIAQAWPLLLVLLVACGVLCLVFGPFVWLHGKTSEEAARRGRERKAAGIANSHDGTVVEEFGVRKGQGRLEEAR